MIPLIGSIKKKKEEELTYNRRIRRIVSIGGNVVTAKGHQRASVVIDNVRLSIVS